MNLSTTCNLCNSRFLIRLSRCWLICHIFFMVIVRSQLSRESDTFSTLFCIVSSVRESFAMSSAKRNSSNTSICTLDSAYNLLRLKIFPLKRYLISKPLLPSWKVSVSMAENIILNSVEASTQLSIFRREWIRKKQLAIILDACKHTTVELSHLCY